MITNDDTVYDVCIMCALAEEANAVIEVFSDHCNTQFEKGFSSTGREYRFTTILNNTAEKLKVMVTWPPDKGGTETSLHLTQILNEFRPRFAAMTGICAGDKLKVKLGDIVVAKQAFVYDAGKIVLDDDGRSVHLHEANPHHPDKNSLQYANNFSGWEGLLSRLQRPISKRQQTEWLLNTLTSDDTRRIDDIPSHELETKAPQWRKIVNELQNKTKPVLTRNRTLRERQKIAQLRYGNEAFPYVDPPQPKVYVESLASGNAVRADYPFKDAQAPVRGTIAIEMEGAAFYRTLADFPSIRCLLVKAVSDYADRDKDDTYHRYASLASATYILAFIREYVTDKTMPRLDQHEHRAEHKHSGESDERPAITSEREQYLSGPTGDVSARLYKSVVEILEKRDILIGRDESIATIENALDQNERILLYGFLDYNK